MTARVVAAAELRRLLAIVTAAGLPITALEALPGGRIKIHTIEHANDNGGHSPEAAEWDAALEQ